MSNPPVETSAPRSVRKASPLGKAVVALAVIALAVPIGARIKTALAQKKAMDDDRSKTAQEAAAKANAPLRVETVHGKPDTWQSSVPFDGTLQPIQDANLAFKATGPLARLEVKIGDFVKKGQLLGALDASEAYAQSKAASAQIKAAQASLALAKDNADRTTAMVKAGSAPGMMATQANGQLDLTAAQLEGAQAQQALAGAAIRNHTLVAPFTGFVTLAPNALGALVVAGQPTFQMKDVSRLRLVGTVNEQDIALVKVGADVHVWVESAKKTVDAKITSVLPAVDPATRRVPVEAQFPNDEKDPLFAGTFVRATVAGGTALSVLRLPATALRPGSQDEVMVVENGKLRSAKIVFARAADGALLVRSGIDATDAVLVAPPPEAKAGDKVDVSKAL